ncbi:MAG: hypothetical protein WCT04_03950 [Planctomycetota bacterium]
MTMNTAYSHSQPVRLIALAAACSFALVVSVAAEDKVPLKLDLPKALFIGTPKALVTANLEEARKGDRPDFMVPKGTTNVAAGKPVTSSDADPNLGKLSQITDGDKQGLDGSYVELNSGLQWVQIDLGAVHDLYAVVLWHYHGEARVYRDVIVQIAQDADFITNVKTIYNNDNDNSAGLGIGTDKEYVEMNEGKIIDAKGLPGRYLRFYTQGSTSSELNHYTEIEIYGIKK